MRKYIKYSQGITLIELLLILAVVSIILLIAIPTVNFDNMKLLTQSKTLCSEIRTVKFLKMTTGKNYRIMLKVDGYTIYNGATTVKTISMKEGTKIIYGEQEIRFTHDGVPVNGGTTITVINLRSGKYYEITIVPTTGRILLKE